ncbi:transposase [Candidatus Dojkabacteria bacterium]|jgi:IS605 OrfB family transposase|nr:transposase [Candidatus Dojkabacteria bacterium]
MVKTIPVKIKVDGELDKKLIDLSERQTKCANYWIDIIRKTESTNIKQLGGDNYYKAKELFKIGGESVQIAGRRAIAMVRRLKKRRADSPYFKKTYLSVAKIKIKNNLLGIIFGDGAGRVWLEFSGQEVIGKIGESSIKKIKGEWFVYLFVEVETDKEKNYKRFMGVDLGIAKTAVICDWNGKNTRFFNGEPYRFKKNKYQEMRKKSQPNIDKGNVYKFLKKIRRKESNWITNENHKISREIVNTAIKNKRSIALEKLTGISERLKVNKKTRKMIKGWSFRQLADFIEYKAKLAGIRVVYVDPRGTSKTCPKCQYCSRSNRRTQAVFKCRQCNYQSNADRVGAINIALRGNTG